MTQFSLDLTQLVFPNNVVELMATRFELIDSTFTVLRRELRLADPNYSIGVAATDWQPVSDSYEMLGIGGIHAPTLEQYTISISSFVKMNDEPAGLIAHSVISKTIRTILAGDIPLRTQLGGLAVTLNGQTERLKRWWVHRARYHSNKLNGANLYLSVNDVFLEVEKVTT